MSNPEDYLRDLTERRRQAEQAVSATPKYVSDREIREANDELVREVLVRKKNQIHMLGRHLASILWVLEKDNPEAAPDLRLHDTGTEKRGLWDSSKIKGVKLGRYIGSAWSLDETPATSSDGLNDRGWQEGSYTPAQGVCLLTDGDLGLYRFSKPEVYLTRRYNLGSSESILDFPPTEPGTEEVLLETWTAETMAFPVGVTVMKNHVEVVQNLVRLEHLLANFAETKGIA